MATRRLDDLGRLVLPPIVRVLLGVGPGDAVDILVRDGEVWLRGATRRRPETSRGEDRDGADVTE